MSDEELITNLRMADEVLNDRDFLANGPIRSAIAIAIRRLTPKPPEPGSVEVRIAVAVNRDGDIGAWGIETPACEEISFLECQDQIGSGGITHGPVIVTASIPPRVVPVVAAEVQHG